MILHLGVTPDRTQKTIRSSKDQSRVNCMQDKCITSCTIIPAPLQFLGEGRQLRAGDGAQIIGLELWPGIIEDFLCLNNPNRLGVLLSLCSGVFSHLRWN